MVGRVAARLTACGCNGPAWFPAHDSGHGGNRIALAGIPVSSSVTGEQATLSRRLSTKATLAKLPQARASRRKLLAAGTAALAGAWALTGCVPVGPADAVTLEHARGEFEAGRAGLIDIREPIEHAGGVVQGAWLLPMSQLAARLGEISTDPSKPVLLICNTQNRSRAALKTLRQRGLAHARYVDGGMSGWVRRGWPVVAPSR